MDEPRPAAFEMIAAAAGPNAGAPSPQLMIRASIPLTNKLSEMVSDQVEEAVRYGKPLILDNRFRVAQLIGGVWLEIFAEGATYGGGDQAAAASSPATDGGEVDPRPVGS